MTFIHNSVSLPPGAGAPRLPLGDTITLSPLLSCTLQHTRESIPAARHGASDSDSDRQRASRARFWVSCRPTFLPCRLFWFGGVCGLRFLGALLPPLSTLLGSKPLRFPRPPARCCRCGFRVLVWVCCAHGRPVPSVCYCSACDRRSPSDSMGFFCRNWVPFLVLPVRNLPTIPPRRQSALLGCVGALGLGRDGWCAPAARCSSRTLGEFTWMACVCACSTALPHRRGNVWWLRWFIDTCVCRRIRTRIQPAGRSIGASYCAVILPMCCACAAPLGAWYSWSAAPSLARPHSVEN